MTEKVAEEVKEANAVGEKIEELVVAKGQAPTGDRHTPLLGYWSLAFEFHRAILVSDRSQVLWSGLRTRQAYCRNYGTRPHCGVGL